MSAGHPFALLSMCFNSENTLTQISMIFLLMICIKYIELIHFWFVSVKYKFYINLKSNKRCARDEICILLKSATFALVFLYLELIYTSIFHPEDATVMCVGNFKNLRQSTPLIPESRSFHSTTFISNILRCCEYLTKTGKNNCWLCVKIWIQVHH